MSDKPKMLEEKPDDEMSRILGHYMPNMVKPLSVDEVRRLIEKVLEQVSDSLSPHLVSHVGGGKDNPQPVTEVMRAGIGLFAAATDLEIPLPRVQRALETDPDFKRLYEWVEGILKRSTTEVLLQMLSKNPNTSLRDGLMLAERLDPERLENPMVAQKKMETNIMIMNQTNVGGENIVRAAVEFQRQFATLPEAEKEKQLQQLAHEVMGGMARRKDRDLLIEQVDGIQAANRKAREVEAKRIDDDD